MLKKFLKNTYLTVFEQLAALAVRFGLPWPEAYRFIGYKNLMKYKAILLMPRSDGKVLKTRDVQKQCVAYLGKYVSFPPSLNKVSQWIDANYRLSSIFLSIPELESIEKASQVARRVENLRQNIPSIYNIPDPGIAFIPRSLAEGSLGVYENLEGYIKAMALGLVPEKKLFFLVPLNTPINNNSYLNYWNRYVTIVRDEKQIKALEQQEQYLTVPILGLFKQYGNRSLVMHAGLGVVREQWLRENRPPLLTLSEDDKERGWEVLKRLGIPKGSWFVGLHVREPGWRDNNAEVENSRNTHIHTYFSAIKAVTDAGGWVIRLGDPLSMTPLPAMNQVIDYAHSPLKSEWMDMFLFSQCRFLIGTASGVYTVSKAFDVPCVMTNLMSPHNIFALTSQDIVLTKVARTKRDKRYLPFHELVAPPLGVAVHAYKDLDLELVDNTPSEIKSAVDEMLMRYQGHLKYTQEDESLQADFKSMVKDCAPLYGDKDIELYARIGRDFLRNHASLLPTKEVRC